jgi:hypothetical protein
MIWNRTSGMLRLEKLEMKFSMAEGNAVGKRLSVQQKSLRRLDKTGIKRSPRESVGRTFQQNMSFLAR